MTYQQITLAGICVMLIIFLFKVRGPVAKITFLIFIVLFLIAIAHSFHTGVKP